MKTLNLTLQHWFIQRLLALRAAAATKMFWAELAVYLCILLFAYTAANKLADVQRFEIQMSQSPMLTARAAYLAWGVPVIELVVGLLLVFPQSRLTGLYSFFSIMAMFTVYIAIIHNYSDEIPCSCGGILEEMSWLQHLLFNLAYMLLAAIAITFTQNTKGLVRAMLTVSSWLAASIVIASGFVSIIFYVYELPLHRPNGFLRLHTGVTPVSKAAIELADDQYYFAGDHGDRIYLGHNMKKLQLIEFDRKLIDTTIHRVRIENEDAYHFRDIRLTVRYPYYYVADGTIPASFRGLLPSHIATPFLQNRSYFLNQYALSETNFVNRLLLDTVQGQVLARETPSGILDIRKDLLEKQFDGQFCVEGSLSYDASSNLITYVYRYRNSFFTLDTNLNLTGRYHTIDTNSRVNFTAATIRSSNQYTLSGPSSAVNYSCHADGGMLYIHARLRADNETHADFRKNSVVDVYDLRNGDYRYSFYVPFRKIRQFIVRGQALFVLNEDKLIIYDLAESRQSKDFPATETGRKTEHL